MFTKKEMKELSKYERNFRSAYKNNYLGATRIIDNDTVAKIYEENTGKTLSHNWGCHKCTYNAWYTIGKLYYESEQYWIIQDTKNKELKQKKSQDGTEKETEQG